MPEFASPIDECLPNLMDACVFVGIDQNGDNGKSKLRETLHRWKDCHKPTVSLPRNEVCDDFPKRRLMQRILKSNSDVQATPKTDSSPVDALFASHSSFGVADLGATKTVIGSDNLVDLMNNLHPQVRDKIERCPCQITFRFGNHGTLQSQHALIIPFSGFRLKVAVVPGATPFLLSNTLLRAIGAVIDTDRKRLWSSQLQRSIPLHLTSKGLFLMDLNDLVKPEEVSSKDPSVEPIETHMTIEENHHKPKGERLVGESQFCPLQSEISESSCETTMKIGIEKPEESPKVPEPISPHESVAPELQKSRVLTTEHSGSRSFAGSFKYPFKTQHGVGSTIEESPGPGECGAPRSFSPSTGRSSPREDRFRTETSREKFRVGVEQRSSLDHMGTSALRLLDQGSPSQAGPLCGTGRKGRATRKSNPCEGGSARSEHQGVWEELPSQAQISTNTADRDDANSGRSTGRRGGLIRDGSQPVGSKSTARCSTPRSSHAQSGECIATSDLAPGGSGTEATGETCCPIDLIFQTLHAAGDVSGDCSPSIAPEACKERHRFQQLVDQYQREFNLIRTSHHKTVQSKPIELLEVFCSSQSTLTHQCQQLGHRAVRFSQEQGDLQSRDGRRLLFETLIQTTPRNVWFSPTCGPLSGWSNLNGSKSIEAWDKLQALRLNHLEQVALGIVLLRYQLENSHHFHWEQPATSMMFRLPYLKEPFYYTLLIDLDMCVAGDLKDPENGKPIKKGLHILTTSTSFHAEMQGLRCCGNHPEHQTIEGSVHFKGQLMNRSKYTELYPRKFARKVARILCSQKILKEKPIDCDRNPSMTLAAADHPLPDSKRRRLAARPKPVRTQPIADDQPQQKRVRLGSKQTVLSKTELWSQLFDKVNLLLPRVGRRAINQPEIVAQIQGLLPEKEIKHVMACKGTSRTIAPPKEIAVGEAPYRLGVYLERHSGNLLIDEEWESWESLSHRNRQLIRPSPECRINITVFAANPVDNPATLPDKSFQPEMIIPQSSPERISQAPEVSVSSLSPSQFADLNNGQQSESFKKLSKEEQIALLRSHKNLGHPSPDRLSTVLRQQGFRPEIVRATMELQCSTCQAQVQPKHARPSTLKDDLDFNDRISIDGLSWTNKNGASFHIYHVIDWATSFHTATIAPSRNTDDMIQALIQLWFQWAGAPGSC